MKKKISTVLGEFAPVFGCIAFVSLCSSPVVKGQVLSLQDATATVKTQPHHLITVGDDALGFSSQTDTYSFEKGNNTYETDTKKVHTSKTGLNYTYLFDNGLMLGAAFYGTTTTQSSSKGSVINSESEEVNTNLLFYTGYNFNSDFKNSWWIQGGIAAARNSQTATSAGVITESEVSSSPILFIQGGRRISLDSWGLPNVSYSPSIMIASGNLKSEGSKVRRDGVYSLVGIKFLSLDLLF